MTQISRVVGDRRAFLPLLVAFFQPFSSFFSLLSSLIFLMAFLHVFWHDSPAENLIRSRANQREKFLIFPGKPKTLSRTVADLPSEAKLSQMMLE